MYNEEQKQQLRVDIATDVIKHIEANIYQANHTYLFIAAKEDIRSKPSLEALASADVCEVCALGALFLNYMERNDRLSELWMEQYDDNEFLFDILNYKEGLLDILKDLFDYEQLQLIECAFEQVRSYADDVKDRCLVDAAYLFGERYEDDTQILISIMQNIIDNNGLFVP